MTTVAEAIARFIANESRVDEFVNETGDYEDSDGDVVETLASFITRKDAEINQRYILNMQGDWVTATPYLVNDLVISSSVTYLCVVAHESGVFATDLAAGNWITYLGYIPYGLYCDTETAVIAANDDAAITHIIPTVSYSLKADLTIGSGKVYAPIPGAIVTTYYSIRSATYRWIATSELLDEYRCELAGGTNPVFSKPSAVWINGAAAVEGTAGSLNSGEWDYSGGFIVVRLGDDSDPDSQAAGYVEVHYTLTFAAGSKIEDNGGQMFNAIINEVDIDPSIDHAIPQMWVSAGTWDRVSADYGDSAATLYVYTSSMTNVWATTLTADRAVTLSTTNAFNGAKFRIVRKASATGAFNLNVGTGPLKALGIGSWCEVEFNGSAWVLTAYSTL